MGDGGGDLKEGYRTLTKLDEFIPLGSATPYTAPSLARQQLIGSCVVKQTASILGHNRRTGVYHTGTLWTPGTYYTLDGAASNRPLTRIVIL